MLEHYFGFRVTKCFAIVTSVQGVLVECFLLHAANYAPLYSCHVSFADNLVAVRNKLGVNIPAQRVRADRRLRRLGRIRVRVT